MPELRVRLGGGRYFPDMVLPESAAGAVVAVLSEAALVSLETTVAVLSASVAAGWLLQLLKNKPPARAGTTSRTNVAGRERRNRIRGLGRGGKQELSADIYGRPGW